MTLHTVYPLERVLEGMESVEYRFVDLQLNGIQMQVEMINPTQAKIIRLYGGALQNYLHPSLQPGQLIEFQPTFV